MCHPSSLETPIDNSCAYGPFETPIVNNCIWTVNAVSAGQANDLEPAFGETVSKVPGISLALETAKAPRTLISWPRECEEQQVGQDWMQPPKYNPLHCKGKLRAVYCIHLLLGLVREVVYTENIFFHILDDSNSFRLYFYCLEAGPYTVS